MPFLIPNLASLLALAFQTLPAKDAAPRTLEIDVELSEFTPPRRLMLDLGKGAYRITTPAETVWPPNYPRPADRSGTVSPSRLAAVRSAVDTALREGFGYPDCELRKRRPEDLFITNAPVPTIIIRVGTERVVAPRDWSCLTPAARRLQKLVDRDPGEAQP